MTNVFSIIFSVCCVLFACSSKNKATREQLIGEWEFETFEPAGSLSPKAKNNLEDAITTNKGIRLIFGADGSFYSSYDPDQKPSQFVFIPGNQQVVTLGDTSKIILLDEKWMKLYRNKVSPVAVFKRIK